MASDTSREAAFRTMYSAHYRQIAAYANRRVTHPEDADDLVAEIFLVAWRRLEDVPGGDLTLPWLYGVARRVLSQSRRSRQRQERLVAKVGRLWGRADTGSTPYERLDDQEIVHQALARLRPDDQELLRLAEWEELSQAELAVVFECSVNAVAIRLHRAHRRFGSELRSLDKEAAVLDSPLGGELR
jgi:RNA polymerase sigma factor (sigma-70 family)